MSYSQGQTRLWEFHPDDITSVGVYSENGQTHEVIVTVLRDFDVAEGTNGLKELNERLSIELKTKIRVDVEHGTSPVGVVLWPPHLAGNALWEFFVIGADGLARYVPPDTPNALKNFYGPVLREMMRPKVPLPGFPRSLMDRAFDYRGEIGWYKDDAVLAAEWLCKNEAAIVGAELWLVKNAVAQPHIRTATGIVAYRYWTATQPSETWEAFASRSLNEVTAFICQFQWPGNTTEPLEQEVRFCLSWVWKAWLEEEGFSFPQ